MSTGLIIVLVIILIFGAYLGFGILRYKKLLKNYGKEFHNPNIVIINDKNFKAIVDRGITMIDFWADWCKPCYILAPIISELADEYKGRVKVGKMDVEANKKVPAKLKIMNIPTVIIFKNGREVQRFIGVKPKSHYKRALDKLLAK